MSDVMPHEPTRPLLWPEIVLDLAGWLADFATPVYVVGGAVRDALLHRPLKDLDLAVETGGITLARKIANHFHGDFFALDSDRDVGRALIEMAEGRITIDVARFRGKSLSDDLSDRDFTMNAMAVDLRGDLRLLIDPLGGERDIQTKQIRRCAPHAVLSDPVRALRAVRQSVQFGMRIEPETLRDIRGIGERLRRDTSPERVRDEFIRMLALVRPASALRVADSLGLLEMVIPQVKPLHGFVQGHIEDTWQHTLAVIEAMTNILQAISPARSDNTAASFGLGILVMQLDRFRARLNGHIDTPWPNERPHKAILILAALLHDMGKTQDNGAAGAKIAGERADSLHLSNGEKQRLVAILRNYTCPLEMDTQSLLEIHRFWWQMGEAGVDACLLAAAEYLGAAGGELNQDQWLIMVERLRILFEAYFERYHELVEPAPLLDGNQLMEALDLKPGPMVGQLIERIREAQVTGEARTVDDALQIAKAYLNGENHK